MAALQPRYIVIRAAAFSDRNCDRDRIDQWHGQVGRDITIPGAYARGINSKSIGN